MPESSENAKEDRFERALAAWGTTARLGDSLGGGNRNDVRAVRIDGKRHAARRSPRPAPSIAWEIELLTYLTKHDLRVPLPIPARDGALQQDGLVIFSWLDGDPPATDEDWQHVSRYLERLHRLTASWPQRPGFLGTHDFLTETTGGDVDLSQMPPEAVALCRDAWRPLANAPHAVIHGDPGPGNIRITANGAGFLDWDESRVDATHLDFAFLPSSRLAVQPSGRLEQVRRAATAWEAANGWIIEPEYARRCLVELAAGPSATSSPFPR